MPASHLTKPQRNEIFRLIERWGFDPQEFQWRECDGEWAGFGSSVPCLVHMPSEAHCAFALLPEAARRVMRGSKVEGSGSHAIGYSPGLESSTDEAFLVSWLRALEHVAKWAASLNAQLSESDLWAQSASDAQLLGAATLRDAANAPFSHNEQLKIAEGLQLLRQHITTTFQLTAGQTQVIFERLDDLQQAASRVGRKDWVTMLLGALVGVVLNAALPSHTIGNVLSTAVKIFHWLAEQGRLQP